MPAEIMRERCNLLWHLSFLHRYSGPRTGRKRPGRRLVSEWVSDTSSARTGGQAGGLAPLRLTL